MNKSICVFFLFILNFNFSQTINDQEHLFNGEIKLEKTVETISTLGDTDNGLFIEININNKNYKFLIDTGASVSVLNDQIFKDIDNPGKTIKVKDLLGNEEEKDLFYLDFKIGESQWSNFAFVKFDFSKFSKNECLKYDGIIGANVLKKLNWKFVKTENKLFFSKDPFTYESFNKPVLVQWAGNIPIVELKVNDHKFLALLDTGHFGGIIFPDYSYIKEFGFGAFYNLTKGKGDPISTVAGRQKLSLKKAQIENLSLGNYNFSGYEVTVAAMKFSNIGNKIILENGFIFNFLNSEIAFGISEQKSKYAILPKIKICKSETNKNQIELCFFWKESDNKNLKLGDQIIQIDSIATTNLNDTQYCSLLDYLRHKNSSKKVTFKRGSKEFDYILN